MAPRTTWPRTTQRVVGAGAAVDRFRAAAGAGGIPWTRDRDRLEEDYFLAMAAPLNTAVQCGGTITAASG